MSALTKKQIVADATLATMVGVVEGTLVSYAELTKAMHQYIKKHKLRKVDEALTLEVPGPPVSSVRYCSACGSMVLGSAAYCDGCGEKQ